MYKSAGFSLLEIMIVLALIICIVSMSIISWNFSDKMLVKIELDRLYAFFIMAQHRAQVDGKTYELFIDSERGIFKSSLGTLAFNSGVECGILKGVKGPPSSPTQPLKNAVSFINAKVVFNADGMIRPGTLYLTDKAHSCLYALTVPVSPISYIRRYHYKNKWIPV